MRTTSLFVLLIVLFGVGFYGYDTLNAIGTEAHPEGGTAPNMLGNGSNPYTSFLDYNATSGELGGDANTTVVGELMDWDLGGAAIAVLDVTGIDNLAKYMIAFINLLVGFVTAPFTWLSVVGLDEFGILSVFAAALVVMFMLAVWQIITGRSV